MKRITVSKGQIIQHCGDLDSKIYKVESGLLRSYTIDENGKEHIFAFAPEQYLIADMCLPSEPCQLNIDALEDSIVQAYVKDPDIDLATKNMLRKRIMTLQHRVVQLISLTIIERYDQFRLTYPNLVHRVPQRMIASYLGVTPEALSKVKGDRIRHSHSKS